MNQINTSNDIIKYIPIGYRVVALFEFIKKGENSNRGEYVKNNAFKLNREWVFNNLNPNDVSEILYSEYKEHIPLEIVIKLVNFLIPGHLITISYGRFTKGEFTENAPLGYIFNIEYTYSDFCLEKKFIREMLHNSILIKWEDFKDTRGKYELVYA